MTRAVVLAYHDVGVRCLALLLANGVDVPLVISHTNDPQENCWFGSVATLALRHGIPLITPKDVNDPEIVARIAAIRPDLLFSFYYRQLLGAPLLKLAPLGAWNMHGSLLPRYRGRAPVNWAVLHGERQTGATLHRMTDQPDAGGIIAHQAVPILPNDTAHEVMQKVAVAAEVTLAGVLPALLAGTIDEQPQDLAAGSHYGRRTPDDGCIDWQKPAHAIHNLVRAVAPPYPGAFSDTSAGRLRVLRSWLDSPAACLETTPATPQASLEQDAPQPRLYATEDTLWAHCGDGRRLRILDAELNGKPLAPGNPHLPLALA